MDPDRYPTAGFFQGWLFPGLLTSGALSNQVLFWGVSGHSQWSHCCWFVVESPPVSTPFLHPFVQNWLAIIINSWRLVYCLTIRHQRPGHCITQDRWRFSTLIENRVLKIGASHHSHCIIHKPLWWPQLNVLALWADNQVMCWLSVHVSPGRWGWTQVGIPQQALFRADCFLYC